MKLVSILVSIFKGNAFIEEKLRNISEQSLIDDCDIILINCQNLENESEICKKYPKFKEILIEEYITLYKAWNIGIESSTSKYITNANIDDLWHPQFLEKCVNHIESCNCDVVSTGVVVTDIPNQRWPNWNTISSMPIGTYPATSAGPCPVWKRKLHELYGLFDDRYSVIGDAKLWEKWYSNGVKFHYIDENLVLYYLNSNSLERQQTTDGILLKDIDLRLANNAYNTEKT